MKKIFLDGYNGFVGTNLIFTFSKDYILIKYDKNTKIVIESDVVIHLAGKAHDIKNVAKPEEYYKVNTEFTKEVYNSFLASNAKVFITLSSVKAVADVVYEELSEEVTPSPSTHYGKSKFLAEQYILSQYIPCGKRVYILRPCMIHGPGCKGNLSLLYSFISKGLPWPLGVIENSRSYLSIENLCFIVRELIEREDIPSGVYNVADDVPLSTYEVINLIAESKGDPPPKIINLSKTFISIIARLGDFFKLPINSERLQKLTDSYVVSTAKIKVAIGKPLPVSSFSERHSGKVAD